jgi:hypothetical protein
MTFGFRYVEKKGRRKERKKREGGGEEGQSKTDTMDGRIDR